MRKIRIGNDISITIHVRHDGKPADFTGRDLTLLLVNGVRKEQVNDFTVKGDVLSFVFKGTEQKHMGKYYLTLYENYGEGNQNVSDTFDAFELVSRSTQADGAMCGNGVVSLDVSLDADVNKSGGDYTPTYMSFVVSDKAPVTSYDRIVNSVFIKSNKNLDGKEVYLMRKNKHFNNNHRIFHVKKWRHLDKIVFTNGRLPLNKSLELNRLYLKYVAEEHGMYKHEIIADFKYCDGGGNHEVTFYEFVERALVLTFKDNVYGTYDFRIAGEGPAKQIQEKIVEPSIMHVKSKLMKICLADDMASEAAFRIDLSQRFYSYGKPYPDLDYNMNFITSFVVQ